MILRSPGLTALLFSGNFTGCTCLRMHNSYMYGYSHTHKINMQLYFLSKIQINYVLGMIFTKCTTDFQCSLHAGVFAMVSAKVKYKLVL